MRNLGFIISVFFIVFSAGIHSGWALSPTPSSEAFQSTAAVIENVTIKGGRWFSEEQLRDVLIQKSGDELDGHGVQSDLRAIADLYRTHGTADTEAWSGSSLITSQITVTPDIVPSSPGHVIVTYNIKEWFPPRD
jgi:outer membrane protein assembly factor BamA